jgi:hypothetical protein
MEAITLENIAAVESAIVVYEEDITWFHGKGSDVLFAGAVVKMQDGGKCWNENLTTR